MTLREYIRDYLPGFLGVHKAGGRLAEMVLDSEANGDKTFAHEEFGSVYDRAKWAMPYQVEGELYLGRRNHAILVLALIIARHRQNYHNEDTSRVISELEGLIEKSPHTSYEDKQVLGPQPEGFWN